MRYDAERQPSRAGDIRDTDPFLTSKQERRQRQRAGLSGKIGAATVPTTVESDKSVRQVDDYQAYLSRLIASTQLPGLNDGFDDLEEDMPSPNESTTDALLRSGNVNSSTWKHEVTEDVIYDPDGSVTTVSSFIFW